jgi:hypothetical protein
MRCIVVGSHQIYIDDKQTQKNWQSCKQKTWVEYALRLKSLILTSLTIPFCFFHLQTHLSTEKFYVQKRGKMLPITEHLSKTQKSTRRLFLLPPSLCHHMYIW